MQIFGVEIFFDVSLVSHYTHISGNRISTINYVYTSHMSMAKACKYRTHRGAWEHGKHLAGFVHVRKSEIQGLFKDFQGHV